MFAYHVDRAGNDYFSVVLQAPTGPLSTRNLRILLEAVPFEDHRSLLHMTYAYSYGQAARWAMQSYLATIGSAKLGFSVVGRSADGQVIRTGGARGVLERNTMRYYLAVEAYLAARRLPASNHRWSLRAPCVAAIASVITSGSEVGMGVPSKNLTWSPPSDSFSVVTL
jgi:hypothetical protein